MQARRQDTFDLRDQIHPDDHVHHQDATYPSDEEHSVLEDDSDAEDREDYIDDDDGSSSLSIPNESIDFDLVYALHSFAATVEGQANVVKGDSLFLMDDSNSYWWLVRVLKTQEVGYIPAENIETPFERLARLNKHRNVDLASATQAEMRGRDDPANSKERLHANTARVVKTPSPAPGSRDAGTRSTDPSNNRRSVAFTPSLSVHRYPPAVWNEEEEDDDDETEWDLEGYEDEDPDLADEQAHMESRMNMEPDDGMSWEDGAVEDARARAGASIPNILRAGSSQSQQSGVIQVVPRSIGSQEQLVESPSEVSASSPKSLDPAAAPDTRKFTVTPTIARDPSMVEDQPRQQQPAQAPAPGPLLPSAIMQQQMEEWKRTREEIEALEEAARKKLKGRAPVTPDQRPVNVLRKDRESDEDSNKEKDKKSKGLFSGIFGRKKDKGKERGVSMSGSQDSNSDLRMSEESSHSSNQPHDTGVMSPTTNNARQQQQQQLLQQQQAIYRNSSDPKRGGTGQQGSPRGSQEQISQHASQLRQYDQQQQQLFQQYLNRSPSSPPEPSYGLNSSPLMPYTNSYASSASSNSNLVTGSVRQRPGSLIISPTTMDGQGVPDLSVIRVFAGKHVQTEATFKTVLLNSSTTASDLVRQAIQRFRLPAGEDASDYFLTMKQMEGSSAVLKPEEKPLGVFESFVEAAMELPKVKRSSVGSLSSISSNLSMHPAIKKLSMNDFTDDSAVKFYLNRRKDDGEEDSGDEFVEETLIADSSHGSVVDTSGQYLTASPTSATSPQERFSSPSFRFALQVVIYPDDLPDDMAFDTQTEAIIFKHTLKDRPQSDASSSSGVSLNRRRKIFVFPKNITVAEVIEIGLERFGIVEGVVDGGDEVEDKSTKRRSSSRVRYTLHVEVGGKDRELSPSSRVVDAYPRPPTYRSADRSFSDRKRRSVDSAHLLGTMEDVSAEDPVFILRRAVAYRHASRRHSAPLDEIALQKMHRDSMSSATSDATIQSDEKRQLSKQEIIAAQRAAQRANQQRTILSTQTNSSRGVDVLLPGNAVIRSSRYDSDDKMRYSYVEPDGETFDISPIVEEELRSERNRERSDDLLQSVLRGKDASSEKFDRVLTRVKDGKGTGRLAVSQSATSSITDSPQRKRSSSPSLYSTVGDSDPALETSASGSRSETPVASSINPRNPVSNIMSGRVSSPLSRLGNRAASPRNNHERQGSMVSMLSEMSAYRSNTPTTPPIQQISRTGSVLKKPRPFVPKDDFGLSHMLAIIELGASQRSPSPPPTDLVEEMFFGKKLDVESLHPQVQDIYSDTFKQLDEMDKILDDLLQTAVH